MGDVIVLTEREALFLRLIILMAGDHFDSHGFVQKLVEANPWVAELAPESPEFAEFATGILTKLGFTPEEMGI